MPYIEDFNDYEKNSILDNARNFMLNLVPANDYFLAKKNFREQKLCLFKNYEILEGKKPFECDPQLKPNFLKVDMCLYHQHSHESQDQTLIEQILSGATEER